MRGFTYVTFGLLVLLLFGSLLGSLDGFNSIRPASVHISKYLQATNTTNTIHPPLFSALLSRLQAWDPPKSEVAAEPEEPLLPASSDVTLILNRTSSSLFLLAFDNPAPAKGVLKLFSINTTKNWNVDGLFWQSEWSMDIPGYILNSAHCHVGPCFCIVYRAQKGDGFVDRVRFFTNSTEALYDDFELPGVGRVTALTIGERTIAYHRFQEVELFTLIECLSIDNVTLSDRVLHLTSENVWVHSISEIEPLPTEYSPAEVVGLQYAYALGVDWMILTSSFIPRSSSHSSYHSNSGLMATHLFYRRNETEWSQFPNFQFNYTFSPVMLPGVGLSYSMSDEMNGYITASVSLVKAPLQHIFMTYSWHDGAVALNNLDLVANVMPLFHTIDPSGTYMLLICADTLVLLKKWREEEYLYQAAFTVDTSDLDVILPNLKVKSAGLDLNPEGDLYAILVLEGGVVAVLDLSEARREYTMEGTAVVAVERLFHLLLLVGSVAYFLYARAHRNVPGRPR